MYDRAAKIYSDLEHLIEISENTSEESELEEDNEPYEEPRFFMGTLAE